MRFWLGILSFLVAAAVWLPAVHLLFEPEPAEYRSDSGVPPKAAKLVRGHIRLWEDVGRRHGHFQFLLPYAEYRPFVQSPPRSHHVDSQVGLMLGAR